MDQLANGLYWLLEWLRALSGNYGLAVIGLTLLVRIVLLPLGVAQFRALEGQKRIQPLLQELQKKYKDRPQELQRRMMELYREHRVNPFSGCLPSLVQLPILWALFLALRRVPQGALFLVWDLSVRDPYLVWPILTGLSQYVSMKISMTDPRQGQTMLIMSLVSAVFAASFPTGLALYWTVSSLFTYVQYWFFQRRLLEARGGVRAS
ncbi:MAG TPA: YidC/Oxa1 family membrane protein insertase [Limnochordales bacterium]